MIYNIYFIVHCALRNDAQEYPGAVFNFGSWGKFVAIARIFFAFFLCSQRDDVLIRCMKLVQCDLKFVEVTTKKRAEHVEITTGENRHRDRRKPGHRQGYRLALRRGGPECPGRVAQPG